MFKTHQSIRSDGTRRCTMSVHVLRHFGQICNDVNRDIICILLHTYNTYKILLSLQTVATIKKTGLEHRHLVS